MDVFEYEGMLLLLSANRAAFPTGHASISARQVFATSTIQSPYRVQTNQTHFCCGPNENISIDIASPAHYLPDRVRTPAAHRLAPR